MECDVAVIGSGASGLATAVTAAHHGLKVIVLEKADVFGGTSAWSGGWLWIPRNPLAKAAGIEESSTEPRRYLDHELGNKSRDPRIDMFLCMGPQMVDFMARKTAVDWIDGNTIPDFHTSPGHARGGRSVSAKPYDLRELGDFRNLLRPPLDIVSLMGLGIAGGADINSFFNASRSFSALQHVSRRLGKHFLDLLRYGRANQLVNGNALVARLIRTALDLNVQLLNNTSATQLLQGDGQGINKAITGVVAKNLSTSSDIRITARRGVVLAAGGYPHDVQRIAETFDHAPGGTEHSSAAPFENTGDGIRLAERVGGHFNDTLVNPGAWAPVSIVKRKDGSIGHFPHLVERAKPGFIAVDSDGRRFVNEANSYHDFMNALFSKRSGETTPHAWLICDHRAQRRYGLGWSKPFPFRVKPFVRNGYLTAAKTVSELARQCDLPAETLEATIDRFNAAARSGKDTEFGRGDSPYNRIQAESRHGPNASLGALDTAPYYAVKLVPGSLGTFAGLNTDSQARVLDHQDEPIEGLFAVGNDMSSIMGGHYPAGGITLGPGMTFGYIAGLTLAEKPLKHEEH